MNALKSLFEFMDSAPGLAIIVAGLAVALALAHRVLRRSTKPAVREHAGLFVTLAGLALFGLVFLFLSFSFPSKGQVDAAVVPRLWIFGLLASCLILLISALRGNQDVDPPAGHRSLAFLFVGLAIVYMILISLIGFYIASFLFVVAGLLILAYRRWLVILAVAGGWVVFSYVVFYKFLFVPLPDGALIELLTR